MLSKPWLVSVGVAISIALSSCGTADGVSPTETAKSGPTAAASPTPIPPTKTPSPSKPPVARVPTAFPGGAQVLAEWRIPNPSFLIFAFDSVWIPDYYGRRITRIDPASNTAVAVLQGAPSHPESALAIRDRLWISGQANDTSLIDPATNIVSHTLKGDLLFMAYGFNSLWLTTRQNELERVDPGTGQVIATIPLEQGVTAHMNEVAVPQVSKEFVWVMQWDKQELMKIDPASNSVASKTPFAQLVDEAKAQTGVPTGKGADFVWLVVQNGLLRISPQTGKGLTFLPLDPFQNGRGGGFAVSDEAVWLAGEGQINRVDVATNRIDATYATLPGELKLGIGFGSLWLRNFDREIVQRLDVKP